ncbi:hypothetical protein CMO93_02800 [Candidatus Woesearchaeota archaeon]|nr:hypothetical protein [Candidatus Woesearchaeota archaeon]
MARKQSNYVRILIPSLIVKASALGNLKKNDEAFATLSYAKSANPSRPEIYAAEGGLHYNQGNFEEAIEAFSQAIELNPKKQLAYHWRGKTYSRLENYPEAVVDLEHSIALGKQVALGKQDHDAYFELTFAYIGSKKIGKAIETLEIMKKVFPANAQAYALGAKAYSLDGQYEQSISDATKALERGIRSKSVYRWRGVSHLRLGKFHESFNDLEEIQSEDRDTFDHANFGFVLEKLGKKGAKDSYEEALRLLLQKKVRNRLDYVGAVVAQDHLEKMDVEPTFDFKSQAIEKKYLNKMSLKEFF